MKDHERWKRVLADEPLPAAVVDLDAVDRNIATLLGELGDGVTLRVASKSVRNPWLLRYILDKGGDRFLGLLSFSAHETALLAEQGFDDIVVAYPFARPDEARVMAALQKREGRFIPVVDSADHLPVLADAARAAGVTIPLCLDVDLSWRPVGGAIGHFGVRRSPIRDGAAAAAVGDAVKQHDGLALTAVLAYEAQVAGMRDVNPGSRLLDPIRQFIKGRSKPLATQRRQEVLDALKAGGHDITLVNGGGTGSVRFTSNDGTVTEVTAGSGFLCSHLFSGYHGLELEPAAFFALSVVRRSDTDHITCAGGGYIASGEAGPSRLPVVWLPEGLRPVDLEGFGEVQTPFQWTGSGPAPALGDPILCRHAKAGELAERFNTYLMVRGDQIVERQPTYRGLGAAFF